MQKLFSIIFMPALALCLILQSAQATKRLLEDDDNHPSRTIHFQGGCLLRNGEITASYWLPDDIWFSIFSLTFNMPIKYPGLYLMSFDVRALSRLSQVCTSWQTIIKSRLLDLSPWGRLLTDECLSQWTHITSVKLDSESIVTDNGLKKLTNLTQLKLPQRYSGNGQQCTDKGIENLINLSCLSITIIPPACSITHEAFKSLTNLTELNIGGHFTRDIIPNITLDPTIMELTTLRTLRVRDLRVKSETIERLTTLAHLTNLRLTNSVDQITDEVIMKLTKLRSLHHDSPFITNRGLEKLLNLTSLKISYPTVGDFEIRDFNAKTLTNLTRLEVLSTTDEAIKDLTALTYLRVTMQSDNLTNAGIKGLTNLTHLDLVDRNLKESCMSLEEADEDKRVKISYNNDKLNFKIDNGNTVELDRSVHCLCFDFENGDISEIDEEDTEENSEDFSEDDVANGIEDYNYFLTLAQNYEATHDESFSYVDKGALLRHILFAGEISHPLSWEGFRDLKKLTGIAAAARVKFAQTFREDCRLRAKAYHHLAITSTDWLKKRQYLYLAEENMAILAQEFPGYINDGGQLFSTFDQNENYTSPEVKKICKFRPYQIGYDSILSGL